MGEQTVFISKCKEVLDTTFVKNDRRGKKTPANKTPATEVDRVKEHINSFPKMESHYCRKSSSRMYLDSHLNMTIMYEMYLEKCKAENVSKPVKKQIYINIFKGEFNLAFHKPKKDTCKICEKFKLSSPEEKKN